MHKVGSVFQMFRAQALSRQLLRIDWARLPPFPCVAVIPSLLSSPSLHPSFIVLQPILYYHILGLLESPSPGGISFQSARLLSAFARLLSSFSLFTLSFHFGHFRCHISAFRVACVCLMWCCYRGGRGNGPNSGDVPSAAGTRAARTDGRGRGGHAHHGGRHGAHRTTEFRRKIMFYLSMKKIEFQK